MVRLSPPVCSGLLALIVVGCAGRSENVTPASGGAGAAASGAGGTGAGKGGNGGTSAGGTSGGTDATGGSGATGGAGGTSGGAGTMGDGGETSGGVGATGGIAASGGASAAGGSTGGTSGMSGAGAGGVAAGPAWLPTGSLGPHADRLIAAVVAYTTEVCRQGLCVLGEDEQSQIEGCVRAELYNFAPSLQWLSCVVRTTAGGAVLGPVADSFEGCAASQGDCMIMSCDLDIPSFPDCPAWRVSPRTCPTDGAYYNQCDGQVHCADGYDERNCDPTAAEYECADGERIPWTAVCDGAVLCAGYEDEFACTPAGT